MKGIIFDYGGTIDTNSRHWAQVLWELYGAMEVPVGKEEFRQAYVHGERTLARLPLVKPSHNFFDVLRLKTELQVQYLMEHRLLDRRLAGENQYAERIAEMGYAYVQRTLEHTRPVVAALARRYRLVLVSNFYGNLQTVLDDFRLDTYFAAVVESAVVGVRKPDPEIFRLGVEAVGGPAGEVLVVGDSFRKDILPAREAGCRTAWLKGEGWDDGEQPDETVPDFIITDLDQLPALLDGASC